MNELRVWHIFDMDPSNADRALPLSTLLPQLLMSDIVEDPAEHFGNTTEVLGLINAEE